MRGIQHLRETYVVKITVPGRENPSDGIVVSGRVEDINKAETKINQLLEEYREKLEKFREGQQIVWIIFVHALHVQKVEAVVTKSFEEKITIQM